MASEQRTGPSEELSAPALFSQGGKSGYREAHIGRDTTRPITQ